MTNAKKPSFTAIGVGQGDAFLLQKGGLTALIDGGRSAQGFPNQFQRVTKRNGVDILVCTHNDADHAAGVLGFLQSGLACKEVWLPGRWASHLEDLLRNPARFTSELISNISERELNVESNLTLESIGDQIAERETANDMARGETSSMEGLSEALEMVSEDQSYHPSSSLRYIHNASLYDWPYFDYPIRRLWLAGSQALELFLEAVSAATMISNIATAAYHAGALIRWFEYDQTRGRGGIADFLVPLNSSEIARIQRPPNALDYLALTTSNIESLVFISPENVLGPSVLFTADSPLKFSQPISWTAGMIITVPHHGSEANASAYKRFFKETSSQIEVSWVRSDGRFGKTPGPSYLMSTANASARYAVDRNCRNRMFASLSDRQAGMRGRRENARVHEAP